MRALTSSEVNDLCTRNFSLGLRVTAHKALVATGQWTQVQTGRIGIDIAQLPIRATGETVNDDKYGRVVIFPAANGVLHFVGEVPADVAAAVAAPPYSSPTGNSVDQTLLDAAGIGKAAAAGLVSSGLLQWAIVGAVIVALYWVTLREVGHEITGA